MVRTSPSLGHNDSTLHPRRHCHGNHKSTKQSIPHLPAYLRRRLPGASGSQHGIRNILLHQLRARNQVLLRSQTRPLHEDTATAPLLRPDGRHPRSKLHADRCLELDVRIHPQHLHSASYQRLHLSHRESPFQRQHSMGRCRSAAVLRTRSALQIAYLGVSGWSHRTDRCVAFREEEQEELVAEGQPTGLAREPELDPTSGMTPQSSLH